MLLHDTSTDLHIYRKGRGVSLIKPDAHLDKPSFYYTGYNLKDIHTLPICVYFLDQDSKIKSINQSTVDTCGFESIKDAINKSMYDVAERKSAEKVIAADKSVMRSNDFNIIEDDVLIKNNKMIQCVSIKLPWLNDKDKIIGILGFTIALGLQPLASSIKEIINLGLLSPSFSKVNASALEADNMNVYLSRREKECMHFLIRGKSAREIADYLHLSRRTVEYYIENIKNKMRVSSKSELIEKFIDQYNLDEKI